MCNYPTTYCLICGRTQDEVRLVRDHNHKTGMIRGMLCEQCNSWLGVYEKNLDRVKSRGRHLYKAWVKSFEIKIKEHLSRKTSIPYTYKVCKHI